MARTFIGIFYVAVIADDEIIAALIKKGQYPPLQLDWGTVGSASAASVTATTGWKYHHFP